MLSGTILYYTIFNFLYASMLTLFGIAPILYGTAERYLHAATSFCPQG